LNSNFTTYHQNEEVEIKKAPKIFQDDFVIDWSNSAFSIHNKIRGLAPKPCAHTKYLDKRVKITLSSYTLDKNIDNDDYGKVVLVNRKEGFIKVATGSGFLIILELGIEGKKILKTKEFLNGVNIKEGDFFN